jgi:YlmC/YmxH family sporulation protein
MFDLRQKEVINECDCKRLGFVADLEFNSYTGCIEAIIVPGPGKFCGIFGKEEEYVIPYSCIKQIGPDVILVAVREKAVKSEDGRRNTNGR